MSKLSSIEELFAGRHFDREVIILCVRWYLRYKLSFRDLVEMMAERVLSLAHTTIMRWVRRYASEFVKRWNRFGRSCGRSWRVDETYIKVEGRWCYLYRAIDSDGNLVETMLSTTRDMTAAKRFFACALETAGQAPEKVCLTSTKMALAHIPCRGFLWWTRDSMHRWCGWSPDSPAAVRPALPDLWEMT